ncbi:hypothetical protein SAMN03080618_03589 [Aquamicrobium aerolatum DSM 21857]|uniref:Uncharacterized protein n=1 Tax=Aquamicrobium aerolatum DSM 21857 TaxID=1121003 RepID=A0A1I3TAK7_9HYPH|nr:hypothetical protein SAMN03080618_03589 [Aquamicrobium aerolatum DSM 21857]
MVVLIQFGEAEVEVAQEILLRAANPSMAGMEVPQITSPGEKERTA